MEFADNAAEKRELALSDSSRWRPEFGWRK